MPNWCAHKLGLQQAKKYILEGLLRCLEVFFNEYMQKLALPQLQYMESHCKFPCEWVKS